MIYINVIIFHITKCEILISYVFLNRHTSWEHSTKLVENKKQYVPAELPLLRLVLSTSGLVGVSWMPRRSDFSPTSGQ